MAENPDKSTLGLFRRKGKKPADVKLCIINRFDRDEFFKSLREYGWEQMEDPFEFERNWTHDRIRKSAREYAAEIYADLLIEIRDKDYSTNEFNDFVYYVWRSTPSVRGIPPPPSYQQTSGYVVAQQMQMQQAAARMQHALTMQQALRAATQAPQPKVVSTGGTCPQCGGNQVQYFDNGLATCPQCNGKFQWTQPPQQPQAATPQPAPPPQPSPTPQPTQQQPPPPQAAPQRPQQQPQQPAVQQPQQRPASYCPRCKIPLTSYPDGRLACSKCGMGGQ